MGNALKFKADGESYEFDMERIMFSEARAIESSTGLTMTDLGDAAQRGSMEAIQAIVWIAVRRKTPATKFSDLDNWAIADVEFIQDDEPSDGESAEDPTGGDEPA